MGSLGTSNPPSGRSCVAERKRCDVRMLTPPKAQFHRNESMPFYCVSFISSPVIFLSSYVQKEVCILTFLNVEHHASILLRV